MLFDGVVPIWNVHASLSTSSVVPLFVNQTHIDIFYYMFTRLLKNISFSHVDQSSVTSTIKDDIHNVSPYLKNWNDVTKTKASNCHGNKVAKYGTGHKYSNQESVFVVGWVFFTSVINFES